MLTFKRTANGNNHNNCQHFSFLQNLLACFHSGSDSFAGDACEVKVAAPSHSPAAEAEYWRIKAMAQQVRTTNHQTLHHELNQIQRS